MIDVQIGDSRQLIHGLADKSIDCVVTSPPYWGLRDYGHPDQIGLEKTPEEYLKKLLDLFDDIKLKLKDDGNCFVNIGDTYSGSGNGYGSISPKNTTLCKSGAKNKPMKNNNLPAKCLCMIPQRFAWGMIERGWILRNEIIWAKPNHMPESVNDRWTKAHETIWYFTKQADNYFDLILEPYTEPLNRWGGAVQKSETKKKLELKTQMNFGKSSKIVSGAIIPNPDGKHPDDVWRIPVARYPENHFAVFPLDLVRRPILAGCPVGGTVLDPFAGSGTIGEFCRYNDRNAILFELNHEYKKLIEDRAMLNIPELSQFT